MDGNKKLKYLSSFIYEKLIYGMKRMHMQHIFNACLKCFTSFAKSFVSDGRWLYVLRPA
jgi:hypothetical protein